jgi:hypothetical protein
MLVGLGSVDSGHHAFAINGDAEVNFDGVGCLGNGDA